MNAIIEKINAAMAEAEQRLAVAASPDEIEQVRIWLLGRNGMFPALSKEMGSVPPQERKDTGVAFNTGRTQLQEWIKAATDRLNAGAAAAEAAAMDPTLPGRRWEVGHRHPISIITDECVAIFRRMGFIVADGPEIEDIYHNFDALNTPQDHPSRDPQDTFYFEDGRILRTQTSPVQIRTMESCTPPIRIVAPGRVYRRDTPDAKIRLRPHFFPFTEPSVEYDFSCMMCGGKGCPVCKNSGYIEIAGAGMVDPNVLRNVGIDPEIYSGFAFGLGLDRLAMLRYRIGDIRYLYENDVRFLGQF